MKLISQLMVYFVLMLAAAVGLVSGVNWLTDNGGGLWPMVAIYLSAAILCLTGMFAGVVIYRLRDLEY